MMMLLMMNLSLSLMFLMPNHPVMMMMIIIIQAMLICLMCGLLTNMWWFSYLTFMVMVGGMLILFMYMTNTASNEKFKTSKIKKMLIKILISLLMLTLMFKDINEYTSNWLNINNKEMSLVIMKYYNYPSNSILFMVMIFLLVTLIMTVKVTEIYKGALRQKF
uniref:NADH-ubiquinone oxidoreductase chain 6 n=1 Tax=Cassida circumdata TaxID=111203 RepID=A0A343L7R1_9CUCU|nr:NADH dehydrogenase subunit 6 [Cassida circumdata]